MPVGDIGLGMGGNGGGGGAPAGDPNFANVVLLSHFDGADASTTFTDVTGKTLTTVGNAQVDTAQSMFGGASGLFDGTGDFVSAIDSADWDFGSGAYTIEFFVRMTTKATLQTFVNQWGAGVANCAWSTLLAFGNLTLRISSGGTTHDVNAAWTATLGVWYHMCFERNASGLTRIYVDGVMLASSTNHNRVVNNPASPLVIGAITATNTFPAYDFNGHMDELRITKGVARYDNDAGFTVPTAAHPDA